MRGPSAFPVRKRMRTLRSIRCHLFAKLRAINPSTQAAIADVALAFLAVPSGLHLLN
jgi:hypothetical protein